jgi:hypothetical protein
LENICDLSSFVLDFAQYQEKCDRGENDMDHHQAVVGAVPQLSGQVVDLLLGGLQLL